MKPKDVVLLNNLSSFMGSTVAYIGTVYPENSNSWELGKSEKEIEMERTIEQLKKELAEKDKSVFEELYGRGEKLKRSIDI